MIFDAEKQKAIILELINSITISGKNLDELYGFKQQVIAGTTKVEEGGK